MNKLLLIICVLFLAGCRLTPSQPIHKIDLYPTPTVLATQTQRVVVQEITSTPAPTQTPNVVIVSVTPNATTFCVSASIAVHLRPSPSIENYPIEVLANGVKVIDLGGRDGEWVFVQVEDLQGWVHGDFLLECH